MLLDLLSTPFLICVLYFHIEKIKKHILCSVIAPVSVSIMVTVSPSMVTVTVVVAIVAVVVNLLVIVISFVIVVTSVS